MLEHLRAQNLGLIRDAELSPAEGLTVVTGETGAGKTLLLGALRLLLGQSSDQAAVGPFADRAQADGLLSHAETELGVSRVVPADGRSRAYVDGALASAPALAERVGGSVEIVGQHDKLKLRSGRYILSLVDNCLDTQGQAALVVYQEVWRRYRERVEEAERLGGSGSELIRELDLVRHQHQEISRAGFEAGEEESLEAMQTRLRHASEIQELLRSSGQAVERIEEATGELVAGLRKVAGLDATATPMSEEAESLAAAASELRRELRDNVDGLIDDPQALQTIEGRLTLLGDLKRKYGKTIAEILQFGDDAGQRASELESLIERSESIAAELGEAKAAVEEAADALTSERGRTGARLEKAITGHLAEVGLEEASVVFNFEELEPGPTGRDRIDIQFSSHTGLKPGPLSNVASGGELSRLILAVSLATSSPDISTLVFDEVDSGMGGATALAMGRKLADLAESRQVLCVTHLPQVAAFADAHYVITRSGDEAVVAPVEGPARLEELSRMLAGLPESDRGQEAARELLELAGR